MDLRQLEIVAAVAQEGSFTGAGRKLHVSQSAVSRQILLLEAELSEPLFVRSRRRVRITPSGDALVRLSQRIFSDIKDTVNVLSDSRQVLTGTLRLAGGMTHCLYVFPTLFKEYRRRHPLMEIKVISDAAPVLLQALRSGTADLGLLTTPMQVPEQLVTVPVLQEEMLLVTHPSHSLARKKRITPQDLQQQRFILFERGSSSRRIIDEFFARESIQPVIVMETQNVEILKALVRVGMGMTFVPYQAVSREVRGGHFFSARIVGADLIRQAAWVYPRTNRLPRMVDEMIQTLQTIMPQLKLRPGRR